MQKQKQIIDPSEIEQYSTRKYIKRYLIILPIIITVVVYGAVFGGYYGYTYWEENLTQSAFKDGWEVGYMQGQIDTDANITQSKEDDILSKLAWLESSNGQRRKILDTNGKYSLGLYHFQATTVKDMYRRYYNKNISIQEAIEIAEDDTKATELARYAIFTKKELGHWHTSMVKLNNLGIIKYK